MDNSQVEDAFRVIDASIAEIKWKLRPSSKNRLVFDILALITGLRPAVMVDYGGHGSELQAHLCILLDLIKKMLLQKDGQVVSAQLESIQKMLFSLLCVHKLNKDLLADIPPFLGIGPPEKVLVEQSGYQKDPANEFSGPIDLSSLMQDSQVTLPTLNGYMTKLIFAAWSNALLECCISRWLLGYPVAYLFTKDHVADAISNLSSKPLHLYMILVCRNVVSKKDNFQELMSFTVPCELSMRGDDEQWAKAFMVDMSSKLERCKQVWRHLKLEVRECYPQSIVL
ncbi:uncharacterized protein LOC116249099 isoform X3 [Nymphaea colorata]|uniref:uncharacterized protein LOC116249099 isoform X3 n=1 Tax=Nymphaea colorata TaxID=210225 RepID=UPI00129DEBE2|nr:uncharacterized protein LOC116249099 isoform X3 [Nymphaea colorata]